MPHDMSKMVAIAAGSRKEVSRWTRILRSAAIGFLVVTATATPSPTSENPEELWVMSDDADEARNALRSAEPPDSRRLW